MLHFHTVIIGSGAAGYAAADRLLSLGVDDVAMITSNRESGTSRNAGSDKQTYYKLSCTDKDSPLEMAQALSKGGGMHKDIAFVEAVNSIRCFNHLVECGVPFPTDKYGRFIGYQTDHDIAQRGTSAGPLTSKYMTECLEKAVLNKKGFTLLNDTTAIRIVVDNNCAVGMIALNKCGDSYSLIPIQAKYIIAATGGAASVYNNSVYPDKKNTGSFGLLADAGCKFCNLTECQYGIASLGIKWNLSGSYQQVIPAYYSIDKNGNKFEFLNNYFENNDEIFENIFLKGYQWPFDSKKLSGSSKIDIAVSNEISKGNRVIIDYSKNPDKFNFSKLSDNAKNYLLSSGATGDTPYERLKILNPQAIEFFKRKGVDLSKEPLNIAVCAQHINGGVDVDINWKTSVENLFAIGEAAGTFGIYRPGGSALNSTQVGALRAAEFISRCNVDYSGESLINSALSIEKSYVLKCVNSDNAQKDYSSDMSKFAAEKRDLNEILSLKEKLSEQINLKYYNLPKNDYLSVLNLYRYKDTIKTQLLLCTVFNDILHETGSRGGSVCEKDGEIINENMYYRNFAVLTENYISKFVPLRELSNLNYNFEAVWNSFNNERGIKLG